MSNNLQKLEKDLRAFAKRCKDIKYTRALLFVFLLTGLLSIAAPADSVETARKDLNTSITDMKKLFKEAKQENNKLMKGSNLELIQLMEQGDHVVKSPWSSWQFGMNYFYNNWTGTYKGRGDKIANQKFERNANGKFSTYSGGKFGNTDLNSKVIEPISAVPIDAAVRPKNIDKQPPTFTVAGADGGFPSFETRTVPSISKIEIGTPANINTFNPPALNFVGSGFGQNDSIGRIGNYVLYGGSGTVVIENFETYNANNFVVEMTNGNSNAIAGSLTANVSNNEGSQSWSQVLATSRSINSPETFGSAAAFINDLRPRNVNYNGNYTFKTNSGNQKIFISYNPAGLWQPGADRQNYTGVTGSGWTGFKEHHTSTFNGDLNIESAGAGITVGVEHQLWNSAGNVGSTDFSNGYSTWLNTGNINLNRGKQIVGIMIDIESAADNANGLRKKNNEQTFNRGTITIGTGNNTTTQSIGIDFGDYAASPTIPVDVELGNIIVNDNNNYGFRMRNLTVRATADTYYDDVTISGGNGKVSVDGTNNVGLAIQKSISANVKDTATGNGATVAANGIYTIAGNKNYERLTGDNPISNYFSLNVDLKGHENVGILRMAGYSANNTNDFIFFDNFTDSNSTTQTGNIGTFDISSNASDSTYYDGAILKTRHGAVNNVLLRTDSHGMQNQGTITINGSNGGYITYQDSGDPTKTIEDAAGNIVMLANGAGQKVVNYGAINQTSAGLKNTAGLVANAGGEAKNSVLIAAVANNTANHNRRTKNDTARTNDMIGKIEMAGAGSIGMYITSGSRGENSGEIKLTSAVGRNAGIFNAGTTIVTGAVLTAGTSDGKIETTGKNSVGLFNENGGTANIKLDNGGTTALNVKIIGNDGASGIYAKGGIVTADDSKNAITNPTSTKGELKIKVADTGTAKGVGVYAEGNAAITLKHSDIDVDNGTGAGGGGIYALGTSNVNVDGATVKYTGEGYAFYTENNGHINADNSKVTLAGKAVGFNVDGATGYTSNVSLNNANIDINSDDVVLLGVKNPTSLNLSNFDTTLLAGSGLNLGNIGGTSSDYKIAVLDGINNGKSFNIDQVLDKSEAVTPTPISTATQSYKYVRNLLLQRSIIDVNADVKAELSSSDATAMKSPNGAVVGLYVTSTAAANSNSETGINVNNVTITSDRTDAGAGAIGLYTNYGKINISNGSTLNIETNTSNTINDKAVGAYVVNSSEIDNKGTINVGGKKSIGLLGLSYRQDSSGNVVGNEFGNGDEGRIKVNNDGNLVLDGEGAKGILVYNNSSKAPFAYTNSSGITVPLPTSITPVAQNTATNDSNGIITLTGEKAVGIYADEAIATNKGIIDLQGTKGQIGLYGTTTSGIAGRDSVLINANGGTIKVGNSTLSANTDVPNIGIFTESNNQVTNDGKITVGDNSYGIYAKNIRETGNSNLTVNQNGVGIFAIGEVGTPGNVVIDNGAKITVNNGISTKESVGVFTGGNNTVNVTDNGSIMDLKDSTFGFVLKAPGTFVNSNTGTVKLANDAVYVYTDNNASNVTNNATLTTTGDRNYGLYGNGTMINRGTIDFSTGNGNVGMYATTGGIGQNYGHIKVGFSNAGAKEYGVGMATGYYDDDRTSPTYGQSFNQGTIENHGIIEVTNSNTMGMYAVGAGSKAINYGTINLLGSETVGMYIDREAVGENWGTIQTAASGLTKVKGVYVANGGYIKNYGTINIAASDPKSAGIWTDKAENVEENANGVNPVTGANQTGTSTPVMKVATASDMKDMGGRTIKVPPRVTAPTVTDANGNAIPIYQVDTNNAIPAPAMVTVTSPSGITSINLPTSNFMNYPSATEVTSLGMYVDTSGVNYTNPIQGMSNLTGLSDINLFFGTEASRYTTAQAIEVGDNILKPYNDALSGVVTAGTTLNVTSSSLTWMAQPTKNATTGLLDKVYLVKVPYTLFAKKGDTQTYNFLAGLEQKYGVEGLGTKEKSILDKISSLNKGEGHILAQAFDELKGHQYSNIQQRTKTTGDILSREFNYLQNEWRNPTKDNNKIKVFGHRGEYNTDTAGVIDFTNNAYGVAYVHENETVKLGRKSGWYAGVASNIFSFKDLGESKETQTMLKAGIFKTMSPASDHNGSLTWTIAGEAFASINNMKRRYWIVDETFEAKSDYTTYGVALKNEIGKDFRTGTRTSIRPYGALNMEYGRYSDIKETGPMSLEVQGNDYFSVQPELGISFNYSQPVGTKSQFKANLTAAYTNEIGKVNDVRNKAKLKGTTTDYYELRGDKEDRKGNGKFDLNIGFDNTKFGVTVNAGYDTKGNNIRGGIGFRAIY